jgi:hypothetical protein
MIGTLLPFQLLDKILYVPETIGCGKAQNWFALNLHHQYVGQCDPATTASACASTNLKSCFFEISISQNSEFNVIHLLCK